MEARAIHGTREDPSRVGREDAMVVLERFRSQMLVTARRYSADHHDAEDAFQRTAEIVLRRSLAGTDDELRRWLRTTVKREALAIRRHRERATPAGAAGEESEQAAGGLDTHEHAERSERLRLGAQALRGLKPQEVRCLVLKAEGYSYEEICQATDWSYTKVNRCLSEGRRAFITQVANIESGAECERIASHLSAVADGEATATDLSVVRPHLKTCLSCRARLREYRAVPARVAALVPPAVLAVGGDGGSVRSFFESLAGAAQHKTAALGERAHQAAELVGGQKVAAVAASAAALAGGGAVTADQLRERSGANQVVHARKAAQKSDAPSPVVEEPAANPLPAPEASPNTPAAAIPAAPQPQPEPAPAPPPPPPPRPSTEFAPEASPATAAPSPAPAPAPAPVPPPASGGGGGEFGP